MEEWRRRVVEEQDEEREGKGDAEWRDEWADDKEGGRGEVIN